MAEWLRSVRSDLYYPNKLTLNSPTLVVYDTRMQEGDTTGRIIIAVREP